MLGGLALVDWLALAYTTLGSVLTLLDHSLMKGKRMKGKSKQRNLLLLLPLPLFVNPMHKLTPKPLLHI